jgi:predicted DNA-binding protein YlxM (UPF0122 family)
MSDPVVTWIEHFIAQLNIVAEGDDIKVQRDAILRMIKSCEDEMDQLEEMLDQLDEVKAIGAFVEMMAHASASCAMFKQALIIFDRQNTSPKIGDWKRGGMGNGGDN